MIAALAMFEALAELPDIRSVPSDLMVPALRDAPAAPGRRVRETAPGWPAPAVYHTLYLPEDWKPEARLPLLVEFTGNGGFTNAYGDVCTGLPEDTVLGYGLSGGRGFLWLSLPYLCADGNALARTWWGDAPAHDPTSTLRYARDAIAHVCRTHGGDSNRVVFCGFSRGAIAGNALGLHDNETARLWSAFFLYSHYDGVRTWPFPGSDRASARTRLQRLNGRPQFICAEGGFPGKTQAYLAEVLPGASNLVFHSTGFRNHSDAWTLRPSPARDAARQWLAKVTAAPAPERNRPLLLANYYCWYHDGTHAAKPFLNWTYPASATNALARAAQRPGEPSPNSVLRPLLGWYDSADPVVAEWHVQLARAAGIDAFLVDWWDTHNGLDRNVDQGIVAACAKLGFKFALLDERAQFHGKTDDYPAMLARGLRRYRDLPNYLRIDGRPVVYLYQIPTNPGLAAADFASLESRVEAEVGPVYWIVDKIEHDAVAARAGDLAREKRLPAGWLAMPGVDALGFYSTFSNFHAHDHGELIGKYRYLTAQAHAAGKRLLLPVHPGHDNSHFVPAPYVMPRRDGQTLRDFLRAGTEAGADMLMVTSWNEWPESTVVEPSANWPDPYQYLRILAEWKGREFVPPELPGRRP